MNHTTQECPYQISTTNAKFYNTEIANYLIAIYKIGVELTVVDIEFRSRLICFKHSEDLLIFKLKFGL